MDLLKQIPAKLKAGPFSAALAAKHGLTRYLLKQMLGAGILEKLAHGVYRVADVDFSEEDQFRAAAVKVGTPSAICLVSALAHYGLTDAIARKTWIMVPAEKRSQHHDIKLLRKRSPLWKIGIEHHKGYSITSLERTLVDALTHRSLIGHQIGLEALRAALKQKKTTLAKVMDLALKLNVVHRIRAYIEVFSL